MGMYQKFLSMAAIVGIKEKSRRENNMEKYTYFVVFEYNDFDYTGTGRCNYTRQGPIKNIDDVKNMEKVIKQKHDYDKVLITNIQRFPI